MQILGIDPGPEKSAWIIYNPETKSIGECGIDDNEHIRNLMKCCIFGEKSLLAIEMIASYGMAVGKTTFETCVWIGRFVELWLKNSERYLLVYRLDVKMILCHDSRAKDANIRQAIIDRFPASGGGATPQVGTKKQQGPLYGVSKDIWSALGVALAAIKIYGSDYK